MRTISFATIVIIITSPVNAMEPEEPSQTGRQWQRSKSQTSQTVSDEEMRSFLHLLIERADTKLFIKKRERSLGVIQEIATLRDDSHSDSHSEDKGEMKAKFVLMSEFVVKETSYLTQYNEKLKNIESKLDSIIEKIPHIYQECTLARNKFKEEVGYIMNLATKLKSEEIT